MGPNNSVRHIYCSLKWRSKFGNMGDWEQFILIEEHRVINTFLTQFLTDKDDVWIVPVKEGVEYMRNWSSLTNDDLISMGQNSVFGCEKLNSPPYSEYICDPLAPCRSLSRCLCPLQVWILATCRLVSWPPHLSILAPYRSASWPLQAGILASRTSVFWHLQVGILHSWAEDC